MNSKLQSYWNQSSLPISETTDRKPEEQPDRGIRRRLSSLSLKIQPLIRSSSSSSSSSSIRNWGFRRSKSVPASIGESSTVREWWEWGWGWILSRKPVFARDLEMNHEETTALGCHSKGSWRHVIFKLRSELTRLVRSDNVGLPQTFRYDSFNYSKNFDDGGKKMTTTLG